MSKGKGNSSAIPDEYRCEVPPAVKGLVFPVYPHDMLIARKEGDAVLFAVISESGKVIHTQVVSASDPSFAHSVRAYIEASEFTPGLRDGKPHKSLLVVERKFRLKAKGGENTVVPGPLTSALLEALQKDEASVLVKAKELDAPVKALSRRAPVIPPAFDSATGEVLLAIIIDEEGRVRLPAVVSESHSGLGASAVQAVSQWLFEAPRCKGRNVKTRVQVPMEFSNTAYSLPKSSAAAAAPAVSAFAAP